MNAAGIVIYLSWYLSIYITIHLHTVYLLCQQEVLEQTYRNVPDDGNQVNLAMQLDAVWSKIPDAYGGGDRVSVHIPLQTMITIV